MVFSPELNDEQQNMLAFLLGAALRALDRPGGYKEFQRMGFGRKHVIEMLQVLGHDTDQLARQHQVRQELKDVFDMCSCGHFKNMHQNHSAQCIMCMTCPMFMPLGKGLTRG